MPKLVPVTRRTLVKRLKEFGFEGPFSGGKHSFMSKGELVLTIPNPHKGRISVALLQRILKQAKISREEWLGE
ncbi:type II toxin-antitoxin system HicA family toxin [Methanolobus bombayensis]|uniref:type II toxin-antitoxin system HicA family toxin n=1 Tax=Methanolobus bombayensis TaxID=38023 RepID=UPI001AEAB0F0|nr:type II toxin-antitoxin system HicA family toxin [Methanolobus bombayensis]MBP1910344.1 putative RNA binding protein YcfA (HicA-like mRNA interferase family) [Methanolobus bombayensis]